MTRRQMQWFRYLCDGKDITGASCSSAIAVMAVDEYLADSRARETYDWTVLHEDGRIITLCELTHHQD